jgi:malonyl-CoA/methylmalonyl-CoA synthetase
MRIESRFPLIARAATYDEHLAIIDEQGEYTYGELLDAAKQVASLLLHDRADLEEARVAFLIPPGFEYVSVLWGIWLAGGIAVPLCISHPPPEVEYVLHDAGAEQMVVAAGYEAKFRPLADRLGLRFGTTADMNRAIHCELPDVPVSRRALILYTSGTTSRPKGVVATYRNLAAQIVSLVKAWEWTASDRILHVLPLHHTHGLINALLCALWAGATCEMLPEFDAEKVWRRFGTGGLTLFMAVPTIYIRLIAAWEKAPEEERVRMSKACQTMRLMVSGSAALPVQVWEKWRAITGHSLLERYGMTEIGMALSNPLHGERRPGSVGTPLPGVKVRLVDEAGAIIHEEAIPGEIQVSGPNVFTEYWGRPEETQQSFREGWFCTGDVAVIESEYFRILGRRSVDIIKTGGYKVSALEIEETLRGHPAILDCSVVGVEEKEWGEVVCAALVLRPGCTLSLDDLRLWAQERLARYKLPRQLLVVNDLPRNAMGKVTKPRVREYFGKQREP